MNPKIYLVGLTAGLTLVSHSLFAQLEDKRGIVVKGAQLELVKDGFSFTEGPAVNRFGDIYFTDQPNDKIYVWNANSNQVSLAKEGTGRSNGLYFQLDSKLIAAADLRNELVEMDLKTGKETVLVPSFKGKKIKWSQRCLGSTKWWTVLY